jgi:hypothetical protein
MARDAQAVDDFEDLVELGDPWANARAARFGAGHLADVLAFVADGLGDLGVADISVDLGEPEDFAEVVVGDSRPHVRAFQDVRR